MEEKKEFYVRDVEVLNYSNSDYNSESQFDKENVIFENDEIFEENFNK